MNAPLDPPPIDWTTRISARVEARTREGDLFPGYVVRLYDSDHPDKPLHCSEIAHGKAGVFGTEPEAESYRDRRKAATLASLEHQDAMRRSRGQECAALQEQRLETISKLEEQIKALRADVREANDEIKALVTEACHPEVLIECPPLGESWVVLAAPALVDGTMGGAPRVLARERGRKLVRREPTGALDEALEAMPKAPKRGRRAAAREQQPVVDTTGQPLRLGTWVEMPGLEGEPRGKIVEIVEPDGGTWLLEVECPGGMILRPRADETVRLDDEQQDEVA